MNPAAATSSTTQPSLLQPVHPPLPAPTTDPDLDQVEPQEDAAISLEEIQALNEESRLERAKQIEEAYFDGDGEEDQKQEAPLDSKGDDDLDDVFAGLPPMKQDDDDDD